MSVRYDIEERPASTPTNKAGVRIEGDCLVVPQKFVFPQVCLITGVAVDEKPKPHTFSAVEIDGDALYGSKTNRTGIVSFSLSRPLRRRFIMVKAAMFIAFVASVAVAVVILIQGMNPGYAFGIVVLTVAACFVGYRKSGIGIYAPRIEPSYIWVRGIPEDVRHAIYEQGKR